MSFEEYDNLKRIEKLEECFDILATDMNNRIKKLEAKVSKLITDKLPFGTVMKRDSGVKEDEVVRCKDCNLFHPDLNDCQNCRNFNRVFAIPKEEPNKKILGVCGVCNKSVRRGDLHRTIRYHLDCKPFEKEPK